MLGTGTADRSADATEAFNKVYYSTLNGSSLINLTSGLKSRMPAWLRDTTGLQVRRQASITVGGQSYQLFIEPVQLCPGTTWLLCGGVTAERFGRERQELPTQGIELALLLVVLGVLALPLLRVLLMTAHERLNLRDALFCGLSLVVGLMLLVLLLLSPTARYNIAPRALDTQLDHLAQQVDGAVKTEVTALRRQMMAATQTQRVSRALLRSCLS